MASDDWIDRELEQATLEHRLRRITTYPATGGKLSDGTRRLLNFASNDYLDLAGHPTVLARAAACLHRYGAGATASRLVVGALPCHEELEMRLAALKGCPAALLFGSGYLANIGIIPSLVSRADRVFADRLAHASLIDGIGLSGARLQRFAHNDMHDLAERLRKAGAGQRSLIVTESVFSMDGDLAPLPELLQIAEAHDAMVLVDEAHATGVFGPSGAGRIREEHVEGRVNLSMGTLSKALGGYGGFVACSARMREWLVNRARGLIYTTALPPAAVGAALGALDVLEASPDLGRNLLRLGTRLRERLRAGGMDTGRSQSHIVPVIVGTNRVALEFASRLREAGIVAVAMRPPTVPEGTARLRLSLTLAHTEEDVDHAAATIIRIADALGVPRRD